VKPTQTLAQIRMVVSAPAPLRRENHNGENLAVALDGAGVLRFGQDPSSGPAAPLAAVLFEACGAEPANPLELFRRVLKPAAAAA
jgi:hypothetical protein